jgi:hypothetical protein
MGRGRERGMEEDKHRNVHTKKEHLQSLTLLWPSGNVTPKALAFI